LSCSTPVHLAATLSCTPARSPPPAGPSPPPGAQPATTSSPAAAAAAVPRALLLCSAMASLSSLFRSGLPPDARAGLGVGEVEPRGVHPDPHRPPLAGLRTGAELGDHRAAPAGRADVVGAGVPGELLGVLGDHRRRADGEVHEQL